MNSCIWKQSIWTTWKHCTWFQTHWTPWLMRLPIALANCPNYFAPLKSWTRKKIFFYLCGPWFTTKLCNLNTTRDWLERLDKGNPPASKPSQWLHPQEARSGPCFHLLWSSSVCRLTLLCFPPSDSSTTVYLIVATSRGSGSVILQMWMWRKGIQETEWLMFLDLSELLFKFSVNKFTGDLWSFESSFYHDTELDDNE